MLSTICSCRGYSPHGCVPRCFLSTLPSLSSLSSDVPLPPPFCIIAVNSLTYLRTASLAFVCTIPCVYIDIISFSASPAVPGYNGTDATRRNATRRSPIGPQWGRNLIYRCTTTPAVLTKIKAVFIYCVFPMYTRESINCKFVYRTGSIALRLPVFLNENSIQLITIFNTFLWYISV